MKCDTNVLMSEARKLLLQMKGEFVWFVRPSSDRALRMEFGSPHLRIREPTLQSGASQAVIDALERRMVIPTGRWHLFIDEAEWCVRTKYYTCRRSDPNMKNLTTTLRQLDGQRLEKVQQSENSHILEFDLGGLLQLIYPKVANATSETVGDMWVLYTQDSSLFSYTARGELVREKGSLNKTSNL